MANLAHGKGKGAETGALTSRRKRYGNEESLIEGWLYRETSVEGLVNARYGSVHSTALATFRKAEAKVPTKVWTLETGCQVSQIYRAEFMVRKKGVSTLWAIASGHYHAANLYAMELSFPPGNLHYKEPLKICFEDGDVAREWQGSLIDVISGHRHDRVSHQLSHESLHQEEAPELALESNSIKQATEDHPIETTPKVEAEKAASAGPVLSQPGSVRFESPAHTVPPPMPVLPSHIDPWEEAGGSLEVHEGRSRSTVEHINGVAVYQEAGTPDGRQGAFMVSAVVTASPGEVFSVLSGTAADVKQLLPEVCSFRDPEALAGLGKKTPLAFDWQLIERLDSHTRIVCHTLRPGGFAKAICAVRETVMQQTWREEEDGTITVLGHSIESSKAPQSEEWSWFSPVRAEVEAASFTIAPLQSRFKKTATLDSCLVSYVLKIDLGGWLSDSSLAALVMQPWSRMMQDAFLQPLLMSVIALRDQVEQGRYAVEPFMMAATPPTSPPLEEQQSMLKKHASRQLKSLATRHSQFHHKEAAGKEEPIPEADIDFFSDTLDLMTSQATLDEKFWSCPGAAGFNVRGPTYLQDHKKIPAEDPIFSLASVDLVTIGRRPYHVAPYLPCIQNSKAPFSFVLNLMVPGPKKLALAMIWAAEQAPPRRRSGSAELHLSREGSMTSHGDSESEAGGAPFDLLLTRFLAGDSEADDKRRDLTLKLIPSVVKGSWVIKQSVGHTPVLLGKKLTTQYHRGTNYFEVDVDISSSRAANSVVGMVQGATNSLVIDMGIVLEGHTEEELPECLLGTVRLQNLDMQAFRVLSEEDRGAFTKNEETPNKKTD